MSNFSAHKHIQSNTCSVSHVLGQLDFSQIIKYDSNKLYCNYYNIVVELWTIKNDLDYYKSFILKYADKLDKNFSKLFTDIVKDKSRYCSIFQQKQLTEILFTITIASTCLTENKNVSSWIGIDCAIAATDILAKNSDTHFSLLYSLFHYILGNFYQNANKVEQAILSYQKVTKSLEPYQFPELWVDSHYCLFQQYSIQFLDQLCNSKDWNNQTLKQLSYTTEDFMLLRSNNREKMIECLEPILLVKSKYYADIELNIRSILFNLYWDREKENKIINFVKSIWHLANKYRIVLLNKLSMEF